MFRFMSPNDLFALLVMLSICGVQSSLLAMVIPKYLACGVISIVFVHEDNLFVVVFWP